MLSLQRLQGGGLVLAVWPGYAAQHSVGEMPVVGASDAPVLRESKFCETNKSATISTACWDP